MDRGLYIAASGMLAEQVRQEQIANDLANASTAGYKADRTTQESFGAMLLTNSVTGKHGRLAQHRRARHRHGHRLDARSRSRRRASRWTSRSTATASSPSRPPRARATRATASSRPTPTAG